MTRLIKIPVKIPDGVEVTLNKSRIGAKGPLGTLEMEVNYLVEFKQNEEGLWFKPKNEEKDAKAQTGTAHRLAANMLKGVSEGFAKRLELQGVGYRVEQRGQNLVFSLGYSNPIDFSLPEGISAEIDSQTKLNIKGVDKQKVGQVAAEIRNLRRPDPYKGKGVRYADEVIILRETKKK